MTITAIDAGTGKEIVAVDPSKTDEFLVNKYGNILHRPKNQQDEYHYEKCRDIYSEVKGRRYE